MISKNINNLVFIILKSVCLSYSLCLLVYLPFKTHLIIFCDRWLEEFVAHAHASSSLEDVIVQR